MIIWWWQLFKDRYDDLNDDDDDHNEDNDNDVCNALYYKLIYLFPHPFLVRNFWVADRLDLCTLSYLVA